MDNQTPKQRKWNRYLTGIGIALMTIITTYLVHTNPNLNMASLTPVGVPVGATDIYVPTYTGGVGESGEIEIKTNSNLTGQTLDSVTFSLNYSPVNALVFENNPIVFDATPTIFQDSAFQMTASPEDGKLIVTIILDAPVSVAATDTLFKLHTQINPDLPVGQVVNLSFSDFAMLNGSTPLIGVADMPNTTITVQATNELKMLNAQATDSTHILVEFSDYLSNVGSTIDYDVCKDGDFDGINACNLGFNLVVSNVEPGTNYGYSQKYVMLTTAAQTAGQEYTITTVPASVTIASNQQGGMDSTYSNTLFYGYGSGTAVLSDFGMESATVSGYNTIAVTFSHPVQAASVTKTDFTLVKQSGGPAITVDNVASVSGSTVTLTVSTALLKDETYLLAATSPTAVLRASDGAGLGQDRVAFAGAKNGPRLISSNITNVGGTYRLQLTFDESIQRAGIFPANPIGYLYTTGTGVGTLIDDSVFALYNHSVSGSTIILENAAFGTLNASYTFAVSVPGWITNAQGVPVDDTYKSISFWGLNSTYSSSVGTVQVTKKDAFVIPKGSLDFSTVDQSEVTVLYDNGGPAMLTQAVSAIGMSGENLEVVMVARLDPDRHYIVRIDNGSGTTLAAKDFAVTRALNISSAQAVSASSVRVNFSESIDERLVDVTDFVVDYPAAPPVVLTGMTIDPGYQSVLLTTAAPAFVAGTYYKVAVNTPADVYSYAGNYLLKRAAYFSGYLTQTALSPVVLSTIDVIDAQTLRMNFSGEVLESSMTPVNFSLFYFNSPLAPNVRTPLTVTAVSKVDADTYELKTAIQGATQNYFVTFNGVKDASGLRLGNAKVFNFFGFQLPSASITLVTPSNVSNEFETNVVISGNNLDIVDQVRVGTEVMTIVSQTATSLIFSVPADFPADLYNITLIDNASNSLVFTSALLVTLPEQVLIVQSDQSKSIPYTVPNDGVTTAKLWALVYDPIGLSSVSSVVINLSQIGGPSTVAMVKDAGVQPQYSQWYTYETTVPSTVQTKDAPYLLPVEVRKGSEKFDGTVSIRVSKDVIKSVAPVIDQAYVSPVSVAPDGTTPIRISAQVTDQDGAATIHSVVADMGALGIGFVQLTPVSEVTEGVELETQYFQSEEFMIPTATDEGDYTITITASDNTGEKSTKTVPLQVSTSANGPQIDEDLSYVSPRLSIPRDAKTTFDLNVYVSDIDGASDINGVTANFGSVGIPPVKLLRDADAGTEGNYAWFKASGLTIPKTSPLGTHEILVTATDKSGGMDSLVLRIEVTHKDTLGDPPRVVEDRGYTTPRVALNDGTTTLTLYAFVQDDDGDVESVLANLSEIGQVGTSTDGTLGGTATPPPSDGSCPTGSNVLVCMNPSVKEGYNGQWYILPGITVSNLTTPSPNPYQVEIIVTDAGGKTTSGVIPVYVGSGDSISDQQELPRALAAIATAETSIEVLFNKEISANSVSSSGRGFTISSESNVSEELPILGATINPAGTVVTLSTANQVPGKRYVLSVSKDVKDVVGRSVIEGAANRLNFSGFQALNRAPVLEYIQATDVNMVELEFRNPLKPSSVRTGSSQTDASARFGVTIYESENTNQRLDVLGVSLTGTGNVLRIKTGSQQAEMKYRINIEGLESYDGTKLSVPLNKGFKGYNLSIALHKAAANYADLNGDGRVDFADFTIFSSVYGTVYFGQGENVAETATNISNQAGQPLEPDPNATVPITSVPAGGTIQ